MRKYIILALFVSISFAVFPQQWSFGGRIGYGSYSMSMLKDFQKLRMQSSELPLTTTDNYPITPFYRMELAINNLKLIDKIGAFYTFNSTGTRSTASDYSGRVDLDAIINANQLGLTFQKDFTSVKKLISGFYTDISYQQTILKTKDFLEIKLAQKIVQKEENKFNSKGFSIEPGVYYKYNRNKIGVQINLGYLIDFNGKLSLDGSKDQWLAVNNQITKPRWTGLRLGLQASYYFNKKLKFISF